MKIITWKGYDIVIFSQDHCPPHCHVRRADWMARFEFSFWHDDVDLLDVSPGSVLIKTKDVNSIRQKIMEKKVLMKARKLWWKAMKETCIVNKLWDDNSNQIVNTQANNNNVMVITSAIFDPVNYTTTLTLKNNNQIEVDLK